MPRTATPGPARPRPRAFTLVEISVGFAVAAVLMVMVWNLFISGGRQMALGTWRSGSTAELRNGLRKLREDVNKASYRSEIKDLSVTVDRVENHFFRYAAGDHALTPGGTDKDLLRWHICKAGRSGKAPTVIGARLFARGRELRYEKTAVEAGGLLEEGDLLPEKRLVNDVSRVEIRVDLTDQESEEEGYTAHIKIETRHPTRDETFLQEAISARIPVEAKAL